MTSLVLKQQLRSQGRNLIVEVSHPCRTFRRQRGSDRANSSGALTTKAQVEAAFAAGMAA